MVQAKGGEMRGNGENETMKGRRKERGKYREGINKT
jgi:hypothetical protein